MAKILVNSAGKPLIKSDGKILTAPGYTVNMTSFVDGSTRGPSDHFYGTVNKTIGSSGSGAEFNYEISDTIGGENTYYSIIHQLPLTNVTKLSFYSNSMVKKYTLNGVDTDVSTNVFEINITQDSTLVIYTYRLN